MVVKLRSEIGDEHKWDLTHLYKNIEELESDCSIVEDTTNILNELKDSVDLSDPEEFKDVFDLVLDTSKVLYKLHTYVNRYFDQEQNNEDADKLCQKISDLSTKYQTSLVFINDTIIHFDDSTISKLLNDERLVNYHFDIKDTYRNKSHYLSKIEEELLSKISDVFSTSNDVYTIFKNTEMKYPTVTLSNGESVIVNSQNWGKLVESDNRDDRKLVYDSYYSTFDDYKNTLSKLMFKFVKSVVTKNKIRKFNSTIESSLNSDNIPLLIYDKLIENVSNNLDKFHDYLNLRKNVLNYTDLKYSDLSNPIVKGVDYKYTYDDAKELLLKSTSILGEDYNKIMVDAISNSWIDVYPNKFKCTGAYMSGSAYDVHPYVLLNYNDTYDSVSTLSHELGHAGHSVLSNKYQPFNKSSYSTFIAEIASTTNEILLFHYMYNNTDDKQLKIFLLNNYIEHFRTTVFRQTMFAEFEKFMYDQVEKDEVLTPSLMNDKYFELLEKYHGSNKDVTTIDKLYSNEWSRIPHFYYKFYVYQYSTSFISSIIISSKLINGDKEQLDKYMELLKSGGSDYPIDLLKKAGVDLTDENCYNIAFEEFSKYLHELKELLK